MSATSIEVLGPRSRTKTARGTVATLWHAATVRHDEELDARDSASTLFRFFRSRHVRDLKLIFFVAIAVLFIHIGIAIILAGLQLHSAGSAAGGANAGTAAVGSLATYLGPAVPVYGAILAWAYLTASKRLGVVDLFACEIATLCRVATIFDVGSRYVAMWKNINEHSVIDTSSAHSNNFVSQEDYFPIFATNSQDLQALEALVVGNITEFYTYMKATRDSQRKLAQIQTVEAAKEATANVIYMLFLGYESGRKAIKDLIEFQPTAAENMIVILLTELVCYAFLCEHFKDDDLRFKRLQLREADYEKVLPALLRQVNEAHDGNEEYWAPAKRTIPELQRRYDHALQTLRRCASLTAGAEAA